MFEPGLVLCMYQGDDGVIDLPGLINSKNLVGHFASAANVTVVTEKEKDKLYSSNTEILVCLERLRGGTNLLITELVRFNTQSTVANYKTNKSLVLFLKFPAYSLCN